MRKRKTGEPELFDVQEVPPYVAGSDTSLEAALSVADKVGGKERRVLEALREHGGSTGDELEVSLEMLHQTVGARLRGLVLKGLVKDSGKRRLTRAGRKAVVWEAVS